MIKNENPTDLFIFLAIFQERINVKKQKKKSFAENNVVSFSSQIFTSNSLLIKGTSTEII